MIDECEYEDTIKQTKGLYEGKGERFMEEEAIKCFAKCDDFYVRS